MSQAEQEHTIEDHIVMGLVLRGVESIIREAKILIGPRAIMIHLPEPIRIPLPQGAPEISGADGDYIRQAAQETYQELATGIRDTIRELEALPPEHIQFQSEAERQAAVQLHRGMSPEATQALEELARSIYPEAAGKLSPSVEERYNQFWAEQKQAEEGNGDGKDNH